LSEKKGAPWWGKFLFYGGLALGGLAVVIYGIYSYLMGPVNTYKDMWYKQYVALVKKMATYTEQNPDGWTASQQQNVDEEEKILDQTTAGLAEAQKGVYDLAQSVILGLTTIGITAVVASKVVSYLKSKSSGQVRTANGAGYIAIMSMADTLTIQGYPTQATNLVNTSQAMFQSYDQPYMQQTITTLQNSLPYLTGVQLIVAQQMIEALQIEIAAIPVWLNLPLPLPI
jgi:hypothetical protein